MDSLMAGEWISRPNIISLRCDSLRDADDPFVQRTLQLLTGCYFDTRGVCWPTAISGPCLSARSHCVITVGPCRFLFDPRRSLAAVLWASYGDL